MLIMPMMEQPKPEETKQVKEGIENYQSIYELENIIRNKNDKKAKIILKNKVAEFRIIFFS